MQVVLLSGGLDSAVCLWLTKGLGKTRAISVDYGQAHRKRELAAAKAIAALADVEHRVVKAAIPWPPMAGDVLPGRNTILLGIASAHLAAWSGGEGGAVVVGCCGADAAQFPDCRVEFLLATQQAVSLGLGTPVHIVAPLVDRTKAQTVAMGKAAGAWDAMALSWTCYLGGEVPCGACGSCRSRSAGFAEAGEADPWHA